MTPPPTFTKKQRAIIYSLHATAETRTAALESRADHLARLIGEQRNRSDNNSAMGLLLWTYNIFAAVVFLVCFLAMSRATQDQLP